MASGRLELDHSPEASRSGLDSRSAPSRDTRACVRVYACPAACPYIRQHVLPARGWLGRVRAKRAHAHTHMGIRSVRMYTCRGIQCVHGRGAPRAHTGTTGLHGQHHGGRCLLLCMYILLCICIRVSMDMLVHTIVEHGHAIHGLPAWEHGWMTE